DGSRFRPERQREPGEPPLGDGAHAAASGRDDMPAMPRVRLGIAPGNYGPAEGRRLPIEFVVEGGPAARAGLEDGDRSIKLGSKDVSDIGSYMAALSKVKPGEEVTVAVLRGEKEMTFKVKPEVGARNRSE